VHERKWEVDSLCYVIRLAHGYWKYSGDASCFDSTWRSAMKTIVATFKSEQRKNGKSAYNFKRVTDRPHDTAAGGGAGTPVNPVGLICSVFRPSDDGTVFPFLIPSNYFAVQSLRQLAEITDKVLQEKAFAAECITLAKEVEAALNVYAVVEHKTAGRILAYETDGYGAHYLIDDSNIPSLVSLPYLGAINATDPLYQSTRKFLLTPGAHPYYSKGNAAEGTTGPHAGRDMIWPMGIIIRAMTSSNDDEIKKCLAMLKATHAGSGFMHEAFYKDDASKFTRKWFAWANTLYDEMMLKLIDEKPHLVA
jgi:meiotically up-regulated gene 157 (Mug157) protein